MDEINIDGAKCICPLDGRYQIQTKNLSLIFSEYGYVKYRLHVEIHYVVTLIKTLRKRDQLCDSAQVNANDLKILKDLDINKIIDMIYHIYLDYDEDAYKIIKHKEMIYNHDVKAIEEYVKEQFDILGLSHLKNYVHFGLTSQDINNVALGIMVRKGVDIFEQNIMETVKMLEQFYEQNKNVTMLSFTHGQPATPTTLGKEFMVWAHQLKKKVKLLKNLELSVKFSGATGGFNAHYFIYPDVNWCEFGDNFVKEMHLKREQWSTQTSTYEDFVYLFHIIEEINMILLSTVTNIWLYCSKKYFGLKKNLQEVGSSAMPHKINPIDFENAEGNIKIVCGILESLTRNLPITRLQRDLSDSSMTRNVGMVFGYCQVILASIKKGLEKIQVNYQTIQEDLDNNFQCLTEAAQVYLKSKGYDNGYDIIKKVFRTGNNFSQKDYVKAVLQCEEIGQEEKIELCKFTPQNYKCQHPSLK